MGTRVCGGERELVACLQLRSMWLNDDADIASRAVIEKYCFSLSFLFSLKLLFIYISFICLHS